ncbi:antibiotic biosynthesis monooxygenase family protein [Muricoccus radiodurans]|uniref:antibiotic biosynthesis monooxygenase family protein n=1 Tax=Muricoccus radiodurans TaxID=2231721 RepID=UPI003CEAA39E
MTQEQPAFLRIWRGRVPRARADEYESYWLAHSIEPLLKKGALGVQCAREDRDSESEFVTLSYWRSVEDMTGGGGGDPTEVHPLDRDPEFLIELPKKVQILRLLRVDGFTGSPA